LVIALGAATAFGQAKHANAGDALALYRMAEISYRQGDFQSAANAFRRVVQAHSDPKWAAAWSHVYLGKIFLQAGLDDRAIREFSSAVTAGDDTNGALEEATKYLRRLIPFPQ
jgi:tetratricopeptide (TPR) repeat protein